MTPTGNCRQEAQVPSTTAQGLGNPQVVFVQITAKVSRIVRIHGGQQTIIQHLPERVAAQIIDHTKFQVGQGADRERNLIRPQSPHQVQVFQGPIAMIDAIDPQFIQRLPDIFGRPFFTGMRNQSQTKLLRRPKHILEFTRRMAKLARVETHADQQ